jgi:hypothetical protein
VSPELKDQVMATSKMFSGVHLFSKCHVSPELNNEVIAISERSSTPIC